MSTVSVIIPTYNYGRFVADAIKSVLDQTQPATEIIVVDDGSTDNTEAVVKDFGDSVRYLRQENAGVCAARNRGVAESHGELIAFFDADDTWEISKIQKQAALFDTDPQIGLVHCGMREFDGDSGEFRELHVAGKEGWVAYDLLLWEEASVIVSGSAIMVSRKAFDEVGGFDPRQKVGEDWDFCYRVARRYKVGFVREPLVNYRSHGAAAHHNVREMERGMSLFYEKAFSNGDVDIRALKGRAYGNFHRILAGSYFRSGDYGQFVKHAAKSLWHRPSSIGYFLAFPIRRVKSANGKSPKASA